MYTSTRAESRRDVFAFTTRAAGGSASARARVQKLPPALNYAPVVINFFPRLRGNTQFQDTFAVIELRHYTGAPRNVLSLCLSVSSPFRVTHV